MWLPHRVQPGRPQNSSPLSKPCHLLPPPLLDPWIRGYHIAKKFVLYAAHSILGWILRGLFSLSTVPAWHFHPDLASERSTSVVLGEEGSAPGYSQG